MNDLFEIEPVRTAVISECGRYRYRLSYALAGKGPVVSLGMVNPSRADGEVDDQTMRKVVGFCRGLDASRVIVWNLFAWRDPDVRALARHADPIGPENDLWIRRALADSTVRIVGWGASAKLPARLRFRWREVAAIADAAGAELLCWGTASDGQPLHPLTLSYDRPLVAWVPPR